MTKVSIIGSGFSGLSAACFLAKKGFEVEVFEKNDQIGGRARALETHGFTYDMGPSWYWMPDVFERFFQSFDKDISEYYTLTRLDPSYRVFESDGFVDVPASMDRLEKLFESLEPGSTKQLRSFLKDAKYKYDIGIKKLVYQPGLSLTEFLKPEVMKGIFKLNLFGSVAREIRKKFKHPTLRKLLEFPSLFLGAKPENTPGLYSLMNYADIVLGTWYPKGGMHQIISAMESLARELGVKFHTGCAVSGFEFQDKKIKLLKTTMGDYPTGVVLSSADYAHTENLLDEKDRNYTKQYWDSRTLAPSALIFYLGVNKKVNQLLHHNLFFDESFPVHASEIYDNPQWPSKPLFYVCVPSKTDPSVAPDGYENIFILMPLATGLNDNEQNREKYFHKIIDRIKDKTGENIRDHIVFKKSYSINNFIEDYNSLRGNAYGLANTLRQTAVLKPSIINKKVSNLFYTGQLTVPGPGVPPSLISGELVSNHIGKIYKPIHSKITA